MNILERFWSFLLAHTRSALKRMSEGEAMIEGIGYASMLSPYLECSLPFKTRFIDLPPVW